MSNLERRVQELAAALGRTIELGDSGAIVQKCAICEVELRCHDSVLGGNLDELEGQLFRFYDQHRCRAAANENTFQRAEHAFVRIGERAIALRAQGHESLAQRADLESQRLVEWVDRFRRA